MGRSTSCAAPTDALLAASTRQSAMCLLACSSSSLSSGSERARSASRCSSSISRTLPILPRVVARSMISCGSSGEAACSSLRCSRAASHCPAASSSSASSSSKSSRFDSSALAATCSAKPCIAPFHLFSSRACCLARTCRASLSRCRSAGSSRLGVAPVAAATSAAVFSTLSSRDCSTSVPRLTTIAFGASSHAPRQPSAALTERHSKPAPSSSISRRTASEPARRQAPAWHTWISTSGCAGWCPGGAGNQHSTAPSSLGGSDAVIW
mmetsp:Transcript_3775/g.12687  ORF Transcript_3775/g.12687 Transcript_3775/m.12687 type:complete len:267 (-) Transcript_3775:139-939(-)